MFHNFELEEHGVRLRPIKMDDANFITALRSDDEIGKFLGDTSPLIERQKEWLARYFERQGDFYFIIEAGGKAVGSISLYDVANGTGEWGRWMVAKGSLVAPASALMIYKFGFENLGLDSIYCRTVSKNAAVVSFHSSLGIPIAEHDKEQVTLKGEQFGITKHILTKNLYGDVARKLERAAKFSARFL